MSAIVQYLLNEDLAILPQKADTWRGNPFYQGQFRYLSKPFKPSWFRLLRWLSTPNPQRTLKRRDNWRPTVRPDKTYLQSDADFFVWLGHACFLFQINGVRLLTDPNFGDMFRTPRLVRPPFGLDELRNIDYILLSHDHRDHVDEGSIKTILQYNRPKKILGPLHISDVIRDWVGDVPIEEAAWYQIYRTDPGEPEVIYLPARHWCRRGFFDFNHVLWGAFLIRHGAHTFYFGGDSAYDWHWQEAGQLFPNLTVAMLGVGAYSPHFMMRESHTNPEEAFRGFLDLDARYFVPMHYGTYSLSDEPNSEPYRRTLGAFELADLRDHLLLVDLNEPVWVADLEPG